MRAGRPWLVDAISTVEQAMQQRWPAVKWCFFELHFAPGAE